MQRIGASYRKLKRLSCLGELRERFASKKNDLLLGAVFALRVSERLKGASAGRFKRGQFDTKGHGNLDGRFLQNLSSELRCGASTENGKKSKELSSYLPQECPSERSPERWVSTESR